MSTTHRTPVLGLCCLVAGGLLVAAANGAAASSSDRRSPTTAVTAASSGPSVDRRLAAREIRTLRDSRPDRDRGRFTSEQNVFLPSTIALADLESPGLANATLPLYTGTGPSGERVHYILTEASDYTAARRLGVNYAPKLANGAGTGGDQQVTVERGRLRFKGAVDFSPERVLTAGPAGSPFPPAAAQPGAVADGEWSSLVVLPSGIVLNAQVVANATGLHDRVISVDHEARTVQLQLLDGWQGGDRYYYHLVTDSSDPVAATIELGVYAPRLAKLPAFGRSEPTDDSALLGFSPTANGETGAGNPDRQGLNSTIVDDDRDPVNVFPLDPDNRARKDNNYSPLWDAHVSMWTDAAIAAGQRRVITGFDDLEQLVDAGLLGSFAGSTGRANEFVGGLRATGIIINCPVIAQPFEGQDRAPQGPRY